MESSHRKPPLALCVASVRLSVCLSVCLFRAWLNSGKLHKIRCHMRNWRCSFIIRRSKVKVIQLLNTQWLLQLQIVEIRERRFQWHMSIWSFSDQLITRKHKFQVNTLLYHHRRINDKIIFCKRQPDSSENNGQKALQFACWWHTLNAKHK